MTEKYPPTLPPSITVGSSTFSSPLLDITNVKGHLALLNKFARLRTWVEKASTDMLYVPQDKDKKWVWFVRLAVERFDQWCRALLVADSAKPTLVVLPPIDVIMVWHSYMLNPRWYAEDGMRLPACQTLKSFERHFMQILLDDHRTETLLGTPSRERVEFWALRTGLGWDPLVHGGCNKWTYVYCPGCAHYIQSDYMKRNNTGYLQDDFRIRCRTRHCKISTITKETLALGKLSWDIIADGSTPASHLAGTYFTARTQDIENGERIKRNIYRHTETAIRNVGHRPMHVLLLERYANPPNMEALKADMAAALMTRDPQSKLIDRILSAYNDDKPYSVELVEAVLRQGSFVRKMDDLGWTAQGFFDGSPGDELVLFHAITRYHAFLNLMASSPNANTCYVPTLDIDLVWHTHQLMPQKYRIDSEQYLGRFLDHNDRLSNKVLTTGFKETTRAWNAKYHVPYTHCRCRIPDSTIGQRLSRVIKGYLSKPPSGSARGQTVCGDHCLLKSMENVELDSDRMEKVQDGLASDRVGYNKESEESVSSRGLLMPIPMHLERRASVLGESKEAPTSAPSGPPNRRAKEVAGCGGECDGDGDGGGGDCGDGGCGGCGGCG